MCRYTGAPYAVALDNCSNAIFLALYYELQIKKTLGEDYNYPEITIPAHTYPAVPCEIIHAGAKVKFNQKHCCNSPEGLLKGHYYLMPTKVIDSALRFTSGMYIPSSHMCLSFTGPYKHLKLGKGGAILTDDLDAYLWFKRARFSGRQECSYHYDDFDAGPDPLEKNYHISPPVIGWNFYMMPEIAARGLQLMLQFFMPDGTPKSNEDLSLPYPDLSKFKIYQQ